MGGPRRVTGVFIAGLFTLVLAGCSSATPSATVGTGSGSSGGAPASGGASVPAGGGGSGGTIATIDACALLTPAEIEQALGSPMQAGEPKTISGDAAGCIWNPESEASGISVDVSITPFSQDLWDGETSISGVEAVDGIGDAAFRGFVSPGVMLIKKGAMEVDLGIVAVFLDEAKVLQGQESLAKLVMSRL